MANKLPRSFHCSTEFTLAVLGGKWKAVILCYLKQRPCRYSELRRLMPMVSDKVLHQLYQWGHENAAKFHVEVGEPLKAFDREKSRP